MTALLCTGICGTMYLCMKFSVTMPEVVSHMKNFTDTLSMTLKQINHPNEDITKFLGH